MKSSDTTTYLTKKSCYWVGLLQLFVIGFALIQSCGHAPTTESWRQQYRHLQQPLPRNQSITETDYYIVFLVAARHLDYWDTKELAKSLVRYGRGKGDIGHSWIYLKGIKDGQTLIIEGGQSGQRGKTQPRFFEGVTNYIKYGYAKPTDSQKRNPRYEPNPIKYLWDDLNDGFYQEGSGGFLPTFAAKVDLTKEKFNEILDYIDPKKHHYERFSLVDNQCSSFVARVASMAGLNLKDQVTVKIEPQLRIGNQQYRLWTDPQYSKITFSTPDVLEKSLMEAVAKGEAEYALGWYLNRN